MIINRIRPTCARWPVKSPCSRNLGGYRQDVRGGESQDEDQEKQESTQAPHPNHSRSR